MNHAGDNVTSGSSQLPSAANWRVYSEKFDDDATTVVQATEPGGNGAPFRAEVDPGVDAVLIVRQTRRSIPTFLQGGPSHWRLATDRA